MNPQRTVRTGLALLSAIGWLSFAAATTRAANETWTGGDDDNFHNTANWASVALPGNTSNAGTPTASPDIATFYDAPGTFLSVDMTGGPRTLGGLLFTGPNDVSILNLDPTNRMNLRAGTSAANAAAAVPVSIQVDAGNVLIQGANAGGSNSDFRTAWNQVWQVAGGSTLTFEATLQHIGTTTTNSVTKTGDGTVVLAGNSGSYQLKGGGWTVSEGLIRVTAPAGGRGNSGNAVLVADGATWEMVNTTYAANNALAVDIGLQLNGNGVGSVGALFASGGNSFVPSGNGVDAALNPNSFKLVTDSSIGVATGSTLTVTDDISGDGGLTKVGGGTLILESVSHYDGPTNVNEGTLLINVPAQDITLTDLVSAVHSGGITTLTFGATPGTIRVGQRVASFGPTEVLSAIPTTGVTAFVVGDVSSLAPGNVTFEGISSAILKQSLDPNDTTIVNVNAGGTLGGTGSINSSAVTVNAGGVLAPGNSIGTFAVGSLALSGTLEVEYDGALGEIDLLHVAGLMDVSTGAVDFVGIDDLDANTSYVFATYGSWNGLDFGSVLNLPSTHLIDYQFGGDSMALVPVPEPSTLLLAGLGLLGAVVWRRRK